MPSSLPRIAVISVNPIRNDQANGILMRSLWRGWPKDRLAQVYFPAIALHAPDWSVCGDYRRIRFWGSAEKLNAESASAVTTSVGTPYAGVAKRIAAHPALLNWLRPALDLWSAHVAPMRTALKRQLRDIQPDCVYALLGNYWLTRVTVDVCRDLNLPFYLHVTDDYAGPLYGNSPLRHWLAGASRLAFEEAVAESMGRAGISPVMAEEYHRRYGRPWDWFTTLIDPKDYQPEPRRGDAKTLRLVYAGGLKLGRDQVLLRLADALQAFCQRSGVDAVLDVFGANVSAPASGRRLEDHPLVRMRGWTDPSTLPTTFHESDILVHVESPDPAIAAYTRWSFSTKLSQYMMAGRPILGVGPADLGSMEMIRRTRSGVTISDAELQTTDRLAEFLTDKAALHHYANQGREWAEEWFDVSKGRARFRERIARICDRPNDASFASTHAA